MALGGSAPSSARRADFTHEQELLAPEAGPRDPIHGHDPGQARRYASRNGRCRSRPRAPASAWRRSSGRVASRRQGRARTRRGRLRGSRRRPPESRRRTSRASRTDDRPLPPPMPISRLPPPAGSSRRPRRRDSLSGWGRTQRRSTRRCGTCGRRTMPTGSAPSSARSSSTGRSRATRPRSGSRRSSSRSWRATPSPSAGTPLSTTSSSPPSAVPCRRRPSGSFGHWRRTLRGPRYER